MRRKRRTPGRNWSGNSSNIRPSKRRPLNWIAVPFSKGISSNGGHSPRRKKTEACEEEDTAFEVDVFELVAAFRRIVAGLDRSEYLEIDAEKMSLTDRINEIMERLAEEKQLTFLDLLGDRKDRKRIVYTFLAILELI